MTSRKRHRTAPGDENSESAYQNSHQHYQKSQRILNLHIKPLYNKEDAFIGGLSFTVSSMTAFCKLEYLDQQVDEKSDAAKEFAEKVSAHFLACRQQYSLYLQNRAEKHTKKLWINFSKKWRENQHTGLHYAHIQEHKNCLLIVVIILRDSCN